MSTSLGYFLNVYATWNRDRIKFREIENYLFIFLFKISNKFMQIFHIIYELIVKGESQ